MNGMSRNVVMSTRFVILPVLLFASLLAARLSVEPQGDSFVVKRDGNVLIESVVMETDIPMEQAKLRGWDYQPMRWMGTFGVWL